jgi:hypothetical protein
MNKTTAQNSAIETLNDSDLSLATGGCYGHGYRGNCGGYGGWGGHSGGHGGHKGGYGGYKPEPQKVVNQTANVTVVISQNA